MKSQELFAGFRVGAGDDRFGQHIKLGDEPNDCKVSGKDTSGAMCVFEYSGRSGWPRHLHFAQDEWIYVVEGEFEFAVGDRRFHAHAGESVFLPRKVSHVWRWVNGKTGKIINVFQPAGKMEKFFREIAKPSKDLITAEQLVNKTYTQEQVKWLHNLFDAHGMDLTGPPLGFE